MKGWIYIATMTNTVGVVKIGYSERDPDERVKEWSRDTGAPGEAKVEYAAWVNEHTQYEMRVHKLLEEHGVTKKGEWFRCEMVEAITAIHRSGTPLYEDVRTPLADIVPTEDGLQSILNERLSDIEKKQQELKEAEKRTLTLDQRLKAHEIAWDEIENRTQQSDLWEKCLTQNDGHKERTKTSYIQNRVAQILHSTGDAPDETEGDHHRLRLELAEAENLVTDREARIEEMEEVIEGLEEQIEAGEHARVFAVCQNCSELQEIDDTSVDEILSGDVDYDDTVCPSCGYNLMPLRLG